MPHLKSSIKILRKKAAENAAFFVVIGFKVKHYKNRGALKFPCHCEHSEANSREGELLHFLSPIGGYVATSSFGADFSENQPCFLLRGKWHEVPIGDKKHVILSVSEISHRTIDLLNKLSLRACRGNPCFCCHCEPQARQSPRRTDMSTYFTQLFKYKKIMIKLRIG